MWSRRPCCSTAAASPGGLLLSVSSGGSLSNYGRDRLGSITALASASGTLTDTYRYDPWGQAIGGSGSSYNPFRYTGTYRDAATGFYQMGARYYQPASGRFTQLDPLPSKLLTVNRYTYTGCNPTNYTDPTGLAHCSEATILLLQVILVAAVAGAVGIAIAFILTLPASLFALPLFLVPFLVAGELALLTSDALRKCQTH